MAISAKTLNIDTVEYRQEIKIKYKPNAFSTTETNYLKKIFSGMKLSKLIKVGRNKKKLRFIIEKSPFTGPHIFRAHNEFVTSDKCDHIDRLRFKNKGWSTKKEAHHFLHGDGNL